MLDVDALPLEELHRAFMYTLVRRRPAEAGWDNGRGERVGVRPLGQVVYFHLHRAERGSPNQQVCSPPGGCLIIVDTLFAHVSTMSTGQHHLDAFECLSSSLVSLVGFFANRTL